MGLFLIQMKLACVNGLFNQSYLFSNTHKTGLACQNRKKELVLFLHKKHTQSLVLNVEDE